MDLNKLYEKCEDQLNLEMKRIYDENAKTPFKYRMSKSEVEYSRQLLIDKIIFSKIKCAIFDEIIKDAARDYELLTFGGDWMTYEWDRCLDEIAADEKMRTFPGLERTVKDMKSKGDFKGITTYFVHQFFAYFEILKISYFWIRRNNENKIE